MSTEVAVVTGTRAEYGLLSSPMRAIRDHDDLSLSVVATGMHLSPQYGTTVSDILDDGFDVDRRVYSLLDGDTERAMAKSLGVGISSFAETLAEMAPDVVLVLGDRGEAFAAGVAAAHLNIPVAHIHGGDSMHGAVIDDSIRHALTKFAHLHFPASKRSGERILKLGEQPWRVTVAGAPGLDDVLDGDYTDPATARERYDIDPDWPLLVVVQHPLTTEPEAAGEQMRSTLDAVESIDAEAIVIYPNADAGGKRIIDVIENRECRAFRSLPRADYFGLLSSADTLVGNSSSGIIEAPSLNLPVVDVGPRQSGRERAANVISVDHDKDAIQDAITRAMSDEFRRQTAGCENPYNHGGAGEVIADQLAELPKRTTLLRKQLTY